MTESAAGPGPDAPSGLGPGAEAAVRTGRGPRRGQVVVVLAVLAVSAAGGAAVTWRLLDHRPADLVAALRGGSPHAAGAMGRGAVREGSPPALVTAAVHHHVTLAIRSLAGEQPVTGARTALVRAAEAARALTRGRGEPELVARLEVARSALEDADDAAPSLARLRAQVELLAPRRFPPGAARIEPGPGPAAESLPEPPGGRGWLASVGRRLGTLVRVRRLDAGEGAGPSLSARESLVIDLQAAELALLRGEIDRHHDAIRSAAGRLANRFEPTRTSAELRRALEARLDLPWEPIRALLPLPPHSGTAG